MLPSPAARWLRAADGWRRLGPGCSCLGGSPHRTPRARRLWWRRGSGERRYRLGSSRRARAYLRFVGTLGADAVIDYSKRTSHEPCASGRRPGLRGAADLSDAESSCLQATRDGGQLATLSASEPSEPGPRKERRGPRLAFAHLSSLASQPWTTAWRAYRFGCSRGYASLAAHPGGRRDGRKPLGKLRNSIAIVCHIC
jgi:hypothetical protein